MGRPPISGSDSPTPGRSDEWEPLLTRSIRFLDLYELPPGAPVVRLLNVDYVHVKTEEGGDLYLTRFGLPFLEQLKPTNWYTEDWFPENREKLKGTSTVYRVRTRPVNDRFLTMVVKWCRVGETIPVDTMTLVRFADGEFNSPFEEFSLVLEMRNRRHRRLVRTHKPLAIYVPPERLQLWQTGRSRSKMERKKATFRDVELDIFRQYILIYEWIKGVSIEEALEALPLSDKVRKEEALRMTDRAIQELKEEGYRVLDIKPAHVIVRTRPDGSLMRERSGKEAYALVDFELLARTPEYDAFVKAERRSDYFRRQAGRFFTRHLANLPPHLHHINIFGVDYIYGCTESTFGMVYVVGNDPGLFDYFLPERWRRTPKTALSSSRQIYATTTKDNIRLVWKVSRVGETPEVPEAVAYGYNSPFEEVAFAVELYQRGLKTIFPRAIYMTGRPSDSDDFRPHPSRYLSHQSIIGDDGKSVLRPDHYYLTVWGFWSGPQQEQNDFAFEKGISVREGFETGLIDENVYVELLQQKRHHLNGAGVEDLNMKGDHLLLSRRADNNLLLEKDGLPEVRICNFELMRRLS